MRYLIFIALLAMALIPENARSESLGLCRLSQAEAVKSPECVRWFFACNMGTPKANPTGPYANLDFTTRYRLLAYATFRLAETSCETFSYVEALAAMQAHISATESDTKKR